MGKGQDDELRSKIMRSVKSKNTGQELIVRKLLRKLGYYYRIHVKTLPGKPDIVFTRYKKVIFVNGCFWHGHGCKKGKLPKSNVEFWVHKINVNTARDKRTHENLRALGWQSLTIWQCELKDEEKLRDTA